jgi:16S rRNA (guanine527-N7)-methyltransferase
MERARIATLLQPFLHGAPPAIIKNISTYIDILLRWNARINLTAIRNEREIVTRHFGESLFAARHLFPRGGDREGQDFSSEPAFSKRSAPTSTDNGEGESRALAPEARPIRVADLGSGAGFPGIPLKLWAPNIALTLIESNQKKSAFLREVSRALTLMDIDIQAVRAETLPPSNFGVVTLRAVERLVDALPVAANLVAPSGRLALLIASSQLDQVHSTLPGLNWQPPMPVPESRSRLLLVGSPEPGR